MPNLYQNQIPKNNENSFFNYLIFQNFYCHPITIKQFNGKKPADFKDGRHWKSILKNFTFMQNPHYESDAQNRYITGFKLVSCKNTKEKQMLF